MVQTIAKCVVSVLGPLWVWLMVQPMSTERFEWTLGAFILLLFVIAYHVAKARSRLYYTQGYTTYRQLGYRSRYRRRRLW